MADKYLVKVSQTMIKFGIIFNILCLFVITQSTISYGCAVPQMGPMPICGGVSVSDGTDVYVIESFEDNSLSNVLIGKHKTSAKFLDIEIRKTERPITVVLSNRLPTVIRFGGATEHISSVIVMGSRSRGWDKVAVSGIDNLKLKFLPVIGRNNNLWTSCGAPPRACIPDQYFNITRSKHRDMKKILDPSIKRKNVTKHIIVRNKDSVVIPTSANQPKKEYTSFESKLRGWRRELELYNDKYKSKIEYFNQSELVSPSIVSIDNEVPSWLGIEKLVSNGELIEPKKNGEEPLLDEFSENFSKKYRSNLDPEFKFTPPIDFIVNPRVPSIKIPRDLKNVSTFSTSVIFLADDKTFEKTNTDKSRYCFFRTNSNPQNTFKKYSKNCSSKDFFSGTYLLENGSSRQARLILKAAEDLENHKKWKTKLCHLVDIPESSKVSLLATEAGRASILPTGEKTDQVFINSPSFIKDDDTYKNRYNNNVKGRVDVQVNSPGNHYFVLKSFAPVEWNFVLSNGANISGILSISRKEHSFLGVKDETAVTHVNTSHGKMPEGCGNSLLRTDPLLGGPALMSFELMFKRIANDTIDKFFSKGMALPEYNKSEQAVLDYTTFVVE